MNQPQFFLSQAYEKKENVTTAEIYRVLAERTGVEQKVLRNVFACFYDIVGETLVKESTKSVVFDGALTFVAKQMDDKMYKNPDGSITIDTGDIVAGVRMGAKLRKTIVDNYEDYISQED